MMHDLHGSQGFHAPYTIHHVDMSLYLADSTGMNAGDLAFATAFAETMEVSETFTKHRADEHGNPFGRIRHIDEEHAISFQHIWAQQRAAGVVFHAVRDQVYVLVVRWEDKFRGTWHKRTYYAVTGDGERLSHGGESYFQEITFDARWCHREDGFEMPPSLEPSIVGTVFYVTPTSAMALYYFDFNTQVFSPVQESLLAGRAEILQGPTVIEVRFNGVPALRIEAGEIFAKGFTGLGGTFPTGAAFPRLEFRFGPTIYASLTAAGELATASIIERPDAPSWENAYTFAIAGDWQASIARQGFAALEVKETLA